MSDTALLVIDVQNDYFPGGKMELERAAANVMPTEDFLKTL